MAQKTVVLGISACIGAYKACSVVRGLQNAGIRVRVVMTKHATELVGKRTFEALTHDAVYVDMFSDEANDPIPHISLAKDADLMIIAPCTANILAKLAHGIADDLLSSTALAMHCPMLLAPAANVHMFEDETTQKNLSTILERGWKVLEGGRGYLACGDIGTGRMAEPEDIVRAALEILEVKPDLAGKRILITAGPTREAIDPVRFISNYSSGKTGFALAEAARDRGAKVCLVTGPVHLEDPTGLEIIRVTSALEMYTACQEKFEACDMAIFSAAVSDFRPACAADRKMKKGHDNAALQKIELVENPDILASLAAGKNKQIIVGYAAETNDVITHARQKLQRKNADIIVANYVGPDIGFGTDDNTVWLISAHEEKQLPSMSKEKIANMVLDKALELMLEKDV